MKEDEIKFFRTCVKYITRIEKCELIRSNIFVREIIDILTEWLPPKRAYYYLEKWDKLGFYDWGVSIRTGWLEMDKLPQRYKDLLK